MEDRGILTETLNDKEKYDKNYIKHEIDLDSMISDYLSASKDKPVAQDDLFDEDTEDIIAKVNELTKSSPLAIKLPREEEMLPVVLSHSDTKEYHKASVRQSVQLQQTAENRAKISEVREYVQTSFDDGLKQNAHGKGVRRFVVTVPEGDDSVATATVITTYKDVAEEVTFDDVLAGSEESEEEIQYVLRDNLLSNLKKKIKTIAREERGEQLHPYDRESDKAAVKQTLEKKTAAKRISYFFCWVFTLPLLYLGISQKTDVPLPDFISYDQSFTIFAILNLILFAGVLFCSGSLVANALRGLVLFRFRATFLLLVMSFISLLQCILLWLVGAEGEYVFLALPALAMLLFNGYDLKMLKKEKTDLKLLSFKPDKTCGSVINNTELAAKVTGNSEAVTGHIRKLPKVEINDFFTRSAKQPSARRFEYVVSPFVLAASLTMLIYGLVQGGTLRYALGLMTVALALLTPLCLPVLVTMPFAAITRRIKLSGAAIIGFDAVRAMAAMDELILYDYDLFPAKTVQMSGIKMYNDVAAEAVIPVVTSVFDYIGGPLAEVFLTVIDNRRELLREVEEARYFDERGIRAIVAGKVTLIGNADMMDKNHIRLPDDGVTGKITAGGKTPLYVALDGKLAAILSIQYNENKLIKKYLRKIATAGVNINFITTDPNLSLSMLWSKYALPANMVRIVPSRLTDGVVKELENEETVAIVTITKDVSAFLRAQSATIKIRNNLYIGMMLAGAMVFVGALILGFMVYMGNFSLATPMFLLMIQMIWSLPFMLITYIYKLLA